MPLPTAARLIAAQVRHDLQELWRSRIAFVFSVLFPLTWLLLLGVLAGNDAVFGDTGVRLMQFVTPTAAAMGVLYGTYPTVASTLALAREGGVLKRVRGTPLPAWVYLAGRIGASAVLALSSTVTMLVVGVLAYDIRIQGRTVLATAVTVVVAITCFAALGLAVASVARSAGVAQAASIASAVVLALISGVLIVGDLPSWADRVAAVFPLKPFNDALRDQFNPFGSGSGWDLSALGVMAAWTVGAGSVAIWTFRWDPVNWHGQRAEPAAEAPPSRSAPVARPRATAPGTPSAVALIVDQARTALRSLRRNPGSVFFATVMPVGLYALMMQMDTSSITVPGGTTFSLYAAAGMVTWGAAVAGFVNMPEVVARARDNGVLKRLRGTPLDPVLYLAGQSIAALCTAVVTAALVLAAGALALDLHVRAAGLLPAAVLLLLGTAVFSACGLALAAVLPSSKAVTAVGLAVLLPVAFFSDVFPSSEPPAWMGTVGSALPMKHLANGLVAALDPRGSGVEWGGIAVLTAWLLVAALVASRGFSWDATGRPHADGRVPAS